MGSYRLHTDTVSSRFRVNHRFEFVKPLRVEEKLFHFMSLRQTENQEEELLKSS